MHYVVTGCVEKRYDARRLVLVEQEASHRLVQRDLAFLHGQRCVAKALGNLLRLEIGCSANMSSTVISSATIATADAPGD
jgi:hypothetical protein